MFRVQKLLFTIGNVEPHMKALNAVGIKNRKIIFNPTYLFGY